MLYKHPITKELLDNVNIYADIFHDEIIKPFEEKTKLEVIGWSDNGISIKDTTLYLPLWFVLKILNDWQIE